MLRRLFRHPTTQAALARLVAGYLALVYATTRWELLGLEHAGAAVFEADAPRGAVVAVWHERLAMMPMLWRLVRQRDARFRPLTLHALASPHRDGQLIARAIRGFGLEPVVGSSRKGGAAGAKAMLRLLRRGDLVSLTPDGPRGPRRRAALGVAQLAAMAGRPILPCGAATSRARLFASWDRFVLPLPFGRGVLVLGAPVRVPEAGPEAALPLVEAALTEAADAADAWVAGRRA